MSNYQNAPIPASAKLPRTWNFADTTLIGVVAYGAFVLAGSLVLLVLAMTQYSLQSPDASFVLGSPAAVAVLWVATRKLDRDFSEYLALNWPRPRQLLLAFAVTAVLLIAEAHFQAFVDADTSWIAPSLKVYGRAGLLIFLIAGCLAAPIMEEFIFRGFLFRGWSQSFAGPTGAIVLTSVIWALIHTQYDWSGQFCIFVSGLVLGYLRWRSNSTWLTVIVHSTINIVVLFSIGPYV